MPPYIKMLFEAMRWVNKEGARNTHGRRQTLNKLSSDLHLHCGMHTHSHTQKRCVNIQPDLQHTERQTDRDLLTLSPLPSPRWLVPKQTLAHIGQPITSAYRQDELCSFPQWSPHLYTPSHSQVSCSAPEFYSRSLTIYRSWRVN